MHSNLPPGEMTAHAAGSTVGQTEALQIVVDIPRKDCVLEWPSPDGEHGGGYAVPIDYDDIYNLKGRLLTLIDATYPDPEQRKAQKDIFWQTLDRWMKDRQRACGTETLPMVLS